MKYENFSIIGKGNLQHHKHTNRGFHWGRNFLVGRSKSIPYDASVFPLKVVPENCNGGNVWQIVWESERARNFVQWLTSSDPLTCSLRCEHKDSSVRTNQTSCRAAQNRGWTVLNIPGKSAGAAHISSMWRHIHPVLRLMLAQELTRPVGLIGECTNPGRHVGSPWTHDWVFRGFRFD